ncbi:aldehyde dehydrogenase [Xylaria sp. CBS 124048]|nr:aldehyde dehydrogenase [Xylaria sp. CBS 124048]
MENADETKSPLDFTTFHNVIDGKLAKTEKTRHTLNPATLERNPETPLSSLDDVNRAVDGARKAAASWAAVPWEKRAHAIAQIADALEANAVEFTKLVSMEQGKPPMWAQLEIATAVQWLRDFSKMTITGDAIESGDERKVITRYTPLGVAVGIVPWNFSVMLGSSKLASAIITGNAFIWKPSPRSPYSILKLAELASRFLPPGVLQALSGGDELGTWLTEHPDVDMVSFTGSTGVGKKVMESCSKMLKRCTLELGGNDAAIVCSDVDAVAAATKIGIVAWCNSGQICIAVKRVYVHESVYDTFLATLVGFAQSLKLGMEPDAFLGPLSNEFQYERVKDLLVDIENTKLTVATGSTKPLSDRTGYYLAPTVIDNPPDNARIVVEEQFGPVIPVMKWSDESDVIQRANTGLAGLGASIWSRDLDQADRIGKQLQAGNIWINCHAEMQPSTPFAGHKHSGLGVEMGVEGLKAYCNVQSVYTRPA